MFCEMPFRSEMSVRLSFSAVDVSVPTAFESANGVGGKASTPSLASLVLACAYASWAFAGIWSAGTLKSDPSAVDVYSG